MLLSIFSNSPFKQFQKLPGKFFIGTIFCSSTLVNVLKKSDIFRNVPESNPHTFEGILFLLKIYIFLNYYFYIFLPEIELYYQPWGKLFHLPQTANWKSSEEKLRLSAGPSDDDFMSIIRQKAIIHKPNIYKQTNKKRIR